MEVVFNLHPQEWSCWPEADKIWKPIDCLYIVYSWISGRGSLATFFSMLFTDWMTPQSISRVYKRWADLSRLGCAGMERECLLAPHSFYRNSHVFSLETFLHPHPSSVFIFLIPPSTSQEVRKTNKPESGGVVVPSVLVFPSNLWFFTPSLMNLLFCSSLMSLLSSFKGCFYFIWEKIGSHLIFKHFSWQQQFKIQQVLSIISIFW